MRQTLREDQSEPISLAEEVRNHFIEKAEQQEAEVASKYPSWREAGQHAATLAVVGFVFFGIHFLVFGTAEGEPPRGVLATIFSTMSFSAGGETWKGRLRHLAAFCAAMALVGLFMRFVVRDNFMFSPIHLGVIAAITVSVWYLSDRHRADKAKRG